MNQLYLASIWAPNAIPADEWKYRNLKRIMFPMIDFLFILAGFFAVSRGVPGISEFFPDPMVDLLAYVLSLSAILCLIGVTFPSQWRIEILGKSVLLGLMTGYFVSLLILSLAGESTRGFTTFVTAIALCPIVWRLSLLGSEWQDRRLESKE